LKGARDNNRLSRDKPGGGTPTCERWCAHKVIWSASSVEAGDREPCGNKDTRVIEVLETTEAPENGHIEIEAFAPRKGAGSIAQLKCIYTRA